MLDVVPRNSNGREWHSASPHDDNICQMVTNFFEAHGVFKATNITTASTTPVASPEGSGALIVTDILLRAAKKNGGSVTVEITDGVNTETVFSADVTNNAVTLAFNIPHGWKGWKDAALQITTVLNFKVDVTVGYAKIPVGQEFTAWDAMR